MAKIFSATMVLLAGMILSGCAVIDFLDGKHLKDSRRNDEPQHGDRYGGSSGGGHSH